MRNGLLFLLGLVAGVLVCAGVPVFAEGEGEGEGEPPAIGFSDLSAAEQGPYFAAMEAWGRQGRMECLRRTERLDEIAGSILEPEVKAALEAAIVPGFDVTIAGIAASMPTPASVRASLTPEE